MTGEDLQTLYAILGHEIMGRIMAERRVRELEAELAKVKGDADDNVG